MIVNSFDIEKDIDKAQKVITSSLEKNNRSFDSNSGIYLFSNEDMSDNVYRRNLQDKKNLLSVIGSGDQVINSILFGSEKITAFDISNFPKYLLLLKLGAIKSLTKEEFMSFFVTESNEKELLTLFKKIANNLDEDTLKFWYHLISNFGIEVIKDSKLIKKVRMEYMNPFQNPYLTYKNSFEIIRERLQDVKLTLLDENIYSLVKKEKPKNKFDLANLSNITSYNRRKDNLELLESIPLSEEGYILNYFFYNGYRPKSIGRKPCPSLSNEKIESTIFDLENKKGGLILSKRK